MRGAIRGRSVARKRRLPVRRSRQSTLSAGEFAAAAPVNRPEGIGFDGPFNMYEVPQIFSGRIQC